MGHSGFIELSVGTFNLNNLFSRFNYEAEVDELPEKAAILEAETTFPLDDPKAHRFRTYRGRLVKGKEPAERQEIAQRIKTMDVDLLAVQEVEDVETLRHFSSEDLGGMYRWSVLIEGNDPRLIDLGLLSRLPIGAVTSWQHAVHPDQPSEPVFGRDALEVEVLTEARDDVLVRVFNNHLKSHFVPHDQDPVTGTEAANATRRRQAETLEDIVASRIGPDGRYVVLGDMNDPPGSEYLRPLTASSRAPLVDALTDPEETRPAKDDDPAPTTKAWTHRYRPSGEPARYELFDHIWLSPSLAERQRKAMIDRRKEHGGDGSDHDPAWVVLDL